MKYFIAAALFGLFVYCTGSKEINRTGETIKFGKGGGFAGTYENYVLYQNGFLIKTIDGQERVKDIKKIEQNQCDVLFNKMRSLNIKNLKYVEPGNMSNYIEVEVEGGVNRIVWNAHGETEIPEDLIAYFEVLLSLVKPAY